jgi:eukaryotic-like serine/threonine-protein kinase
VKSVGGYLLEDRIGRGAMGSIHRARHPRFPGHVFAVKLMARAGSDGLRERFKLELKALERVTAHPNVVRVLSGGEEGEQLYYVMELVDGRTLEDAIRERGPLPEREALEIGRAVAQALEAIHSAGLVHRDVKPLNILIAQDGTVKLTDLGLAREVGGAADAPGAVFGSPHTISPEQVQGEQVDIRADLYGLGATLFQALTGKPPYEGTEPVSVMTRHVTEPVPDPRSPRPEVSEGASRLVMWLMAKRREDRPASPTQVVDGIRLLLR